MDPAALVNTKDPSALLDPAAQTNLAGLAKVTPMSKAFLASLVDPAALVAAKARPDWPPAAKTRICVAASKSVRRHAGDGREQPITSPLRTRAARVGCWVGHRPFSHGMSAIGT